MLIFQPAKYFVFFLSFVDTIYSEILKDPNYLSSPRSTNHTIYYDKKRDCFQKNYERSLFPDFFCTFVLFFWNSPICCNKQLHQVKLFYRQSDTTILFATFCCLLVNELQIYGK